MVRTLGRGPVNPFHVEREVARSKNIHIFMGSRGWLAFLSRGWKEERLADWEWRGLERRDVDGSGHRAGRFLYSLLMLPGKHPPQEKR